MTFLLDTDTFILLLRGTSLSKARTERQKAVSQSATKIGARCRRKIGDGHRVGLSAISLAELEFGICHSGAAKQNRAALNKALAPFEAWPFDPVDGVTHYGAIRADLESRGLKIGPLDTLIAAHASALGATLVSHNLREFRRIPGLKVADWA